MDESDFMNVSEMIDESLGQTDETIAHARIEVELAQNPELSRTVDRLRESIGLACLTMASKSSSRMASPHGRCSEWPTTAADSNGVGFKSCGRSASLFAGPTWPWRRGSSSPASSPCCRRSKDHAPRLRSRRAPITSRGWGSRSTASPPRTVTTRPRRPIIRREATRSCSRSQVIFPTPR